MDILKSTLRDHQTDQGIISAKEAMLEDLSKRFQHTLDDKHYYIATLLDPRFRDRFLDDKTVTLATDYIEELTAVVRNENEESVGNAITSATDDQVQEMDAGTEIDDDIQASPVSALLYIVVLSSCLHYNVCFKSQLLVHTCNCQYYLGRYREV